MATFEFQVRGRKEFREAAADLRKYARTSQLVDRIADEMKDPARSASFAARGNALAVLPKRGGLAALIAASKFSLDVRTEGKSAGVRIEAKLPKTDLVATDRGRIRHPVYGNRRAWVSQAITPYWFTGPMLEHAPEMYDAAWRAIDGMLEELARGH